MNRHLFILPAAILLQVAIRPHTESKESELANVKAHMYVQQPFQRLYIKTISMERNNFLKSMSSPKIPLKIYNGDNFTLLYGL